MYDPLKNFVEQHRAEFDHLDAPNLKLDQLKVKFNRVHETQKKNFSLLKGTQWLAAASILIALTFTGLFFYNSGKEKSSIQLGQHTTGPNATHNIERTDHEIKEEPAQEINKHLASNIKPLIKRENSISTPTNTNLYAALKDSTSASRRLLAIIEIEKSGTINNQVLDMLASTLNQDQNTNVRLAALSLMEKYSYDEHVSSLLVSSLNKQNDPIVQLGLVSLLGKMNNIQIDDKLQSLANNPETFAAVRDEAYHILLTQNKL